MIRGMPCSSCSKILVGYSSQKASYLLGDFILPALLLEVSAISCSSSAWIFSTASKSSSRVVVRKTSASDGWRPNRPPRMWETETDRPKNSWEWPEANCQSNLLIMDSHWWWWWGRGGKGLRGAIHRIPPNFWKRLIIMQLKLLNTK
jgi:hypothetical protein